MIHKHLTLLAGGGILSAGLAGAAPLLLNGGFEVAPFPANWTGGSGLVSVAGLNGSATAARLPYNTLATLNQALASPVGDFTLDLCFQVAGTNEAQAFYSEVGTSAGPGFAVRTAVGGKLQMLWNGTWLDLANVNSGSTSHAPPNQTVKLRIVGRQWGSTNAACDLAWSDPGAAALSHAASNLQAFAVAANVRAGGATFVRFDRSATAYNSYIVDEVAMEDTVLPLPPTDYRVSGLPSGPDAIVNISGTYPHLSVFSGSDEIGIGAVVPWAGKLWFITYPPHGPGTTSDKLWTIDTNLTLTVRPESVGGTHANRMVHRESQQLVIGCYFVDTNGNVRTVSRTAMPGRLTANARHLGNPAGQICFATMEEGFYAVDVNTLAVTVLKPDAQGQGSGAGLLMPGAHGKGFYSSQGRYVYANNGESSWTIGGDPGFNAQAGLLGENPGADFTNGWTHLERSPFTEVTGPGGINGNTNASDPIWSLGWDKRSVMLKLLDNGNWFTFRLPKGSYTHDAYHGWYTEWPRIREIVDGKMLMHMHGLFYYFPKTFASGNTGGLTPICSYLKMPVDYCWWQGQLVVGRDDTSVTGGNSFAGQSHSAPWFGQLSDLETWGPAAGFGGPWKEDSVSAGIPSQPFLVDGFQQRVLHLRQSGGSAVEFALQHDPEGRGDWKALTTISVQSNGYAYYLLPSELKTTWVRLIASQNATNITAYFHLGNPPQAPTPGLFAGIADASQTNLLSDGIIRPQSGDARTLQFAATIAQADGTAARAYYEIDGAMQLRRTTNNAAENLLRTTYSLSNASFTVDSASVLVTSGGNRFRLPKGSPAYDASFASGWPRGAREVVTERQLFQAHGTFFELPLSGSGGFRRMRPITTHNRHISDYASWRGLFVIAGVAAEGTNAGHIFRSDDGQAALWFGNVDDLWRMGSPRGVGGPWKDTQVEPGVASDPYLFYGYERRELALSHAGNAAVTFIIEVDFAADNTWSEYQRFTVPAGQTLRHEFPAGYSAHWVRLRSESSTTATAIFTYGPAAPRITSATIPEPGVFQLTATGSPGQLYSVRSSVDFGPDLINWPVLSTGVFGLTQLVYRDFDAAEKPARLYGISTP